MFNINTKLNFEPMELHCSVTFAQILAALTMGNKASAFFATVI